MPVAKYAQSVALACPIKSFVKKNYLPSFLVCFFGLLFEPLRISIPGGKIDPNAHFVVQPEGEF